MGRKSCLDRLSEEDKTFVLTSEVSETSGIQSSWFENELVDIRNSSGYKCEGIHIDITELFFKKMHEKNLTITKLAKKMKIPIKNLKRIFEDSNVITLYDIVNIANVLDLDVKIEIK